MVDMVYNIIYCFMHHVGVTNSHMSEESRSGRQSHCPQRNLATCHQGVWPLVLPLRIRLLTVVQVSQHLLQTWKRFTLDLSAERKTTERAASVPVGRQESSGLGKSRHVTRDTCRIDVRHRRVFTVEETK